MVQGNRQLAERTENEIRIVLSEELKIDIAYMNNRDKQLLAFHVGEILKDSRMVSNDNKVRTYVQRKRKELDEAFQKQQAAHCIRSDIRAISDRKHIDPILNYALQKMIQFNDQEMLKENERVRDRYLKEAWKRLYIANQIISDYSEVCSYLREHAERPETIRSLAQKIRKDKYRIDRRYYSVDAVISKGNIELRNFMLRNERLNDRELSIQ